MELVIMAAGMGSRFGGLKQIEPVGPNGEFIIDYNIYDAVKCGFDKVVLIIKEEQLDTFKNTIGARLEGHVEVAYAFQKRTLGANDLERDKPWGTAHAILSAKDGITGNFAVINSDDYYGYDCFKVMAEKLKNLNEKECSTVGYVVENTITDAGSVKRGVLETKDNIVTKITECLIEKEGNKYYATKLGTDDKQEISNTTRVSMNALVFNKEMLTIIEEELTTFANNIQDETKDEFLIPEVIENRINKNELTLTMINTTAKWYGMTYKEDLEGVKQALINLTNEGLYPNNLWQ